MSADERSPSQRCHDGLKLGLKAGIAAGGLGSHRGHAVTVIVRTTLTELNRAAHAVGDPAVPMPGPARTGGGSVVPMRDVIRMAADTGRLAWTNDTHPPDINHVHHPEELLHTDRDPPDPNE